MKKLLIYLGLADVPAPAQRIANVTTVHIEREVNAQGYNQWMAYICEQLGYPKDVVDKYKQQI